MNTTLRVAQKIYINANRQSVWSTLTDPEKIKAYLYGTQTKSEWKEESEIVFEGEFNGTSYRDKGVIKAFIPERKLQYTYWSSFTGVEDKPQNYSLVTFILSSFGEGTELTLVQEGFENLESQKHSLSSWDMVLQNLKEVAER